MNQQEDIYNPEFVETLFDSMSESYDRMNYITSFGFSSLWRVQMVRDINLDKAAVVVDLMCGMGECWKPIVAVAPSHAVIHAIDFSGGMVRYAESRLPHFPSNPIHVVKSDIFQNELPDHSVDCVVSGFGMKTFNTAQLQQLAIEIRRLLKPGGTFSLIDVSVPKNPILRFFYLFYLKRIIPILGWLFLGNPSNYRMLGVYTSAFGNSQRVAQIFRDAGLHTRYEEYFYGCASGVKGFVPNSRS